MDGNGRWAQARGLERTEGHAAGEEALFDAIEGAKAIGVKWLTVFAFFNRKTGRGTPEEVKFLKNFNESLLERRSHELNDMGIRIRFAEEETGVSLSECFAEWTKQSNSPKQ